MPYYTVLNYTILFYTALYYIILHHAILVVNLNCNKTSDCNIKMIVKVKVKYTVVYKYSVKNGAVCLQRAAETVLQKVWSPEGVADLNVNLSSKFCQRCIMLVQAACRHCQKIKLATGLTIRHRKKNLNF